MVDVRPYPHSPSYEKLTLSCFAQRSFLLDEFPEITESHFYILAHRFIFKLIQECRTELDHIDLIKAVNHANEKGTLEDCGGPGTITDCFGAAIAHQCGQIREYTEILSKHYSRRLAILASYDLIEAAFDTSDDEEFLRAASEPITAIHDVFAGQRKESGKAEALTKFAKAYEDRITGRNNGRGYQISLTDINEVLGGLYTKQIMIIAGKPTSGKSILGSQLLWDLAEQGIPVTFLSLELPGEKVMERLAIYVSQRPALAISKPLEFAHANESNSPTKFDIQKVQNVIRRIIDSPFQVDDSCGQFIGQIVAKIRRHHRIYGTKFFALDYAQLIKSARSKNASKEEESSEISHILQALAKELDIGILLLSQLNQNNQTKYASTFFEDADTMLRIIMDDDTNYHRAIGLKKDRHNGKTGETMPIVFDKLMLRFIPKPFDWDSKAPDTIEDAKPKYSK
jgi:replicative DNA helicase